jgi:hypothetical protein
VKKCASCTKDLPDAALHCVFCGAKQPPAPAVQQGLAKTAFGYSANDPAESARQPVSPHGRTMPAQPQPQSQPQFHPPSYQPPRPPPPAPAPAALRPPAPQPYPHGAPGGGVPTSPSAAPTLFAPSPAPLPAAHQPTALQSPGYGRSSGLASAAQPTLVPSAASSYQPPAAQAYQPPQVPMMQIPAAQPPPYLASQTASRASRPIEPWRDSLRLMMFLWGVALIAAFAMPLQTTPDLLFSWKLLLEGEGTAKLPPLMLAAVGLLSVIIAGIPMPASARGLIAAVLGLAGVGVPIALIGAPAWRPLASLIGALLIVPGLLMRSEYRDAVLPRILVTIGALGILAPFLVPEGSAIPLVNVLKGLIDQPGTAKLAPALSLGLIVVVVMSLLAWLPAPVTGGAKLWAWLVILWGLITHAANLVLLDNLADTITATPNLALVAWIAGGPGLGLGAAYLVLVGYGLASVVGKQLE